VAIGWWLSGWVGAKSNQTEKHPWKLKNHDRNRRRKPGQGTCRKKKKKTGAVDCTPFVIGNSRPSEEKGVTEGVPLKTRPATVAPNYERQSKPKRVRKISPERGRSERGTGKVGHIFRKKKVLRRRCRKKKKVSQRWWVGGKKKSPKVGPTPGAKGRPRRKQVEPARPRKFPQRT